uniref:Uncharacterized protein n=1 Tax=Setaria viridis TaxID=4556 RepID=A0A4U6V819_SETVI|nr:hypothetical protein SEVIR_3G051150v2 [Setaria viridis]
MLRAGPEFRGARGMLPTRAHMTQVMLFSLFASAYSASLSTTQQCFPLTTNQPFQLFSRLIS